MSKELVVDGKNYLPSTVLAGRFSYTTDYLGKLAREEKVSATRVGRQWYISEESLQKFVASTSEAKARRNHELREERQAERESFSAEKKVKIEESTVKEISLASPTQSLMQAVAVVACGFLVGFLGFVAYEGGVEFSALSEAAESTAAEVAEALQPPFSIAAAAETQTAFIDFSVLWGWLFGKTEVVVVETVEVVNQPPEPLSGEVYVQNAMLMLDPSTSTTTAKEIQDSFSDEVEVTFDGPNTGILQPVFKEKTDESYRFLLVPVTEAKEK